MAAMAGRLAGKICLITGGTCGIGLAAARRFVEEGAKVVVTGRNHNRMEQAVAELGAEAVGIACDSTKSADLDRLYEDIRERFGRIDVLFVCAGSGTFAELGTISEEFVDSIFDLNVKSVIFTVQKALPLLSDGASIVLTGSVVGSHGIPAFSVYGASKAAVRALARGWTMDLRARKIRINVVSPGPTQTPGLSQLAGRNHDGHSKEELASTIPLGRLGTAEECANAVLFLASDEASFVTGIEFFVDGGVGQI
ncbi:MAG TPA: SDR family oxidoreductase [Acidocella sp.]|nr:SDR family oxidoreductase [Acidocella sp.]